METEYAIADIGPRAPFGSPVVLQKALAVARPRTHEPAAGHRAAGFVRSGIQGVTHERTTRRRRTVVRRAPMSDTFPELADLWSRRANLSEAEWTRLYKLVMGVLAANPVHEESDPKLGGPHGAEALRQSFFMDKVLVPATAPGANPNPTLELGGLPSFYRNYLKSQFRKLKSRPQTGLPDDDDGRMADRSPGFGIFGTAEGDCECLEDSDEVDSCALQKDAREFLRDCEEWVVLYLALHFCMGRSRLPLSKVHEIYRIPSYHHKARKLGIAPPRGGYRELADFGDTLLGRWLTDNGIELVEKNLAVIRHAFDLLCMEAFAEHERRRPKRQETSS
jgi:hypothetical protein